MHKNFSAKSRFLAPGIASVIVIFSRSHSAPDRRPKHPVDVFLYAEPHLLYDVLISTLSTLLQTSTDKNNLTNTLVARNRGAIFSRWEELWTLTGVVLLILPTFRGRASSHQLFVSAFGYREGQEGYEAKYDLDGNGEIAFSEQFLIFASRNFSKNLNFSDTI